MALSHSPSIVTNGLVLNLDAANRRSYPGTGTVWRDLSGNNNHGTLTNGPTFSSENSGVLTFDGINDRVDITGSLQLSIPITFSCWVMRTSNWHFSGSCLFWAKPNGDFTGNGFYLEPGANPSYLNHIMLVTNGAATNYMRLNQTGNTSFPLNTWTYFSFTILNSSTGQFYLNTIPVSTSIVGSLSITSTVDTKYLLTNSPAYGSFTPAIISSYLIYNRALSASEIAQNFNALRGRFGV